MSKQKQSDLAKVAELKKMTNYKMLGDEDIIGDEEEEEEDDNLGKAAAASMI